eukprot:Tbor_TRINITY_DN5865_c0_g3::TRINITY_DN5865_c0_g3_i1::g.6105::m.6105
MLHKKIGIKQLYLGNVYLFLFIFIKIKGFNSMRALFTHTRTSFSPMGIKEVVSNIAPYSNILGRGATTRYCSQHVSTCDQDQYKITNKGTLSTIVLPYRFLSDRRYWVSWDNSDGCFLEHLKETGSVFAHQDRGKSRTKDNSHRRIHCNRPDSNSDTVTTIKAIRNLIKNRQEALDHMTRHARVAGSCDVHISGAQAASFVGVGKILRIEQGYTDAVSPFETLKVLQRESMLSTSPVIGESDAETSIDGADQPRTSARSIEPKARSGLLSTTTSSSSNSKVRVLSNNKGAGKSSMQSLKSTEGGMFNESSISSSLSWRCLVNIGKTDSCNFPSNVTSSLTPVLKVTIQQYAPYCDSDITPGTNDADAGATTTQELIILCPVTDPIESPSLKSPSPSHSAINFSSYFDVGSTVLVQGRLRSVQQVLLSQTTDDVDNSKIGKTFTPRRVSFVELGVNGYRSGGIVSLSK